LQFAWLITPCKKQPDASCRLVCGWWLHAFTPALAWI
jgi:hypothetical protein